MFSMQSRYQLKYGLSGTVVKIASWLVRQQKLGLCNQRPRQGRSLLLATGKFARTMVGTIVKPNLFEPVQRFPFSAGFRYASHQ